MTTQQNTIDTTTIDTTKIDTKPLPGSQALALLQILAHWETPTTTIILHGGCVFECKGPFPYGSISEGYYNLHSNDFGFSGHINLERIDAIHFQDRPHRGRESYAFDFRDAENNCIFKVFLGRDEDGELLPEQVQVFQTIRQQGMIHTDSDAE